MSFTCDAVEAQCQTEISLIAWHKGIATTQTAAAAAATLLLIRRGNELVAVFPTSPLGARCMRGDDSDSCCFCAPRIIALLAAY